jgi:hypothetical protein
MFRFSIRDVLWLTVVVALAAVSLRRTTIAASKSAVLVVPQRAEAAAEIANLRRELLIHEEALTRMRP